MLVYSPMFLVFSLGGIPRISGDFGGSQGGGVTGSSPVTHPKISPEIPRNSGLFLVYAYICAYIPVNLVVGSTHKEAPEPAVTGRGQKPTSKEST